MAVYDKEKERTVKPNKEGSHDDLGVHPERREAEADALQKLYDAESAPDPQIKRSSAEKSETSSLSDASTNKSEEPDSGWNLDLSKKKGVRTRFQNARKLRRYIMVGAGLSGIIVSIIVLIFSFLIPFKLHHIIETIEDRVGNVPENAVENRVQFYVTRYLMASALEKHGLDPKKHGFTYIGNGWFDMIWTNHRGAKLDGILLDKYGLEIRPINKDTGVGRNFSDPTEWELVSKNLDGTEDIVDRLDRFNARQFMRSFAAAETKPLQLIKRHGMRKTAKKYKGINNWKPFEKQTDAAKATYREKKLTFKRHVIRMSVGQLSPRYGEYFTCILDGDRDTCKRALRGEAPSGTSPDLPQSEIDEAANDYMEVIGRNEVGEAAETASRTFLQRLSSVGLSKFITSVVPIVGWVDLASSIVQKLDDGSINQIIYARNATQYVGFAAPFLSANDQLRAGEDFDAVDPRVAMEILDGYEKSEVYRAGNRRVAGGTVDSNTQIRRDCNNNGQTTDEEDLLEPGEVVCPNKRILQDKTSFTNHPSWNALETVSDGYENTVGGLVDWINGAISWVLDKTGISSVVSWLMDNLGVSEAIARGFEWIMNRISAPVITGSETGGDAYDAIYAGISVMQSDFGGAVGENREDTIGGKPLSNAEIATIKDENMAHYAYELKQKPWTERYFSPYVKESLTSHAVMTIPTSVGNVSSFLSSLLNPSNIVGSFTGLFSGKVNAFNPSVDNPFKTIYYGYPVNHPVFTANNGNGMNPDEVWERYQCHKPAAERPQNQNVGRSEALGIPFEVPLEEDPCLLEEMSVNIATMYFTGTYDEGIDEASAQSATTGAPAASNAKGEDTSRQTCTVGTDAGLGDTPDPNKKIRLCTVGGITVNVAIEQNVKTILDGAATAGIQIGGSGYRSYQRQIELRTINGCPDVFNAPSRACRVPTARPGNSMHEWGLAVDLTSGGTTLTSGSAGFRWMSQNTSLHNLINLPVEPWHWSTTGN